MSSVALEDYIYTWYESNAEQYYDNIESKVPQNTRSKNKRLLNVKESLLQFRQEHDEDNSFDPEIPPPNNPTELLEWKHHLHAFSKNCFMTTMLAYYQYGLLQKNDEETEISQIRWRQLCNSYCKKIGGP